jgi:hypothetical protein
LYICYKNLYLIHESLETVHTNPIQNGLYVDDDDDDDEYPLGMNAYLLGMSLKRTLPKFGGGHDGEYEDTGLWDVIT